MHKKLKKDPDNVVLKITYTRYRNFINKLLKNVKRMYLKSLLLKAKTNIKSTWNTVKNITYMNYNKIDSCNLTKINPDPYESVNKVNQYFVNVGRTLANKILEVNSQYNRTISQPSEQHCSSMAVMNVDENEIDSLILSLRNDCAVGWDGISSHILKATRRVIVPIFTHICNLALSTGVFPTVFKLAIVHPIHKSGDKDTLSNYRPISVLPALSKILEKVINKRLTNYLESKGLIANNQYGFRRGISTSDAVSSLTDLAVEHLDGNRKCLGIFLDITKAFDTVSIPCLLLKLESLGVRGIALDIFRDYLSNRRQAVKIGNYLSSFEDVLIGVPQGSVLGPTLFIVFINDLCQLQFPNCRIFTYADDTSLLVHGSTWQEVRHHAEHAFAGVMKWLSCNLLTLNIAKTCFLPFALQSSSLPPVNSFVIKAHTCLDYAANCTCPCISTVPHVKYLGVYIDQHLNWKHHIKVLTARVRKLIFVFKSLRHVLDIDTIKMIYSALCVSILTYCNTSWSGAAKTTILSLERAQRAVIKVMTRKPFRYPTQLLYKETSLLTVRQLFVLQVLIKKHAELHYDPSIYIRKRRHDVVCCSIKKRTAMAKRHYQMISSYLYNNVNAKLHIYPLSKYELKAKVTNWLLSLNYTATEDLLQIIK